jgi:hypothetical protein
MDLLTVELRKENGCYTCKFYQNVKKDTVVKYRGETISGYSSSGFCKKYIQLDYWTEAIDRCKEESGRQDIPVKHTVEKSQAVGPDRL